MSVTGGGPTVSLHSDIKPPCVRLVVVPSSVLPGVLSLRAADAEGRATGHLKHELRDAGFEVGDVVEVVLVRRTPAAAGGAR